jgi:hypothetical protein
MPNYEDKPPPALEVEIVEGWVEEFLEFCTV